jgi:hypothetical protein
MFCQRCGARLFSGTKICPNCGAPVEESGTSQREERKPNRKSRTILFIAIGVVILAGIALVLYFNLLKPSASLEILSVNSQWTGFNSILLVFGEVENKTGNYVEPRFKVILEKDSQQVGSDYFGSLIKEPPQDLDPYEVREGKLKPRERGYYLVAVRDVKDLEFDQFFVSAEIVSQMTEKEASALREAVKDYSDKISNLMQKWMDDLRVANSTARIALAPIVAMLQEDKRQFAAIEPPAMPEVQSVAIA